MDSDILVVEDTASLREVLCAVLGSEGYSVCGVESGEAAIQALSSSPFSLTLCDLKLPGLSGLDVLAEAKRLHPDKPFVVMTAYGDIDTAVSAMKMGATDFIRKPFDPPLLCLLIREVLKHRRIIHREADTNRCFLTHNAKVEKVLHQARRVGALGSTVLVLGESGTGKELLARHIHAASPRQAAPFVAVNCGSIPEELLESEFFGHEAGAFTGATEKRLGLFEVASGGTIFLDEIGNMPLALQMKLLRTLQESEIRRVGGSKTLKIDTRVISATNCDIVEASRNGIFREDLYYRLSVVVLEIPPLRERKEDIPLLAQFFVERFSAEFAREAPTLTPQALRALEAHSWPGNVRELENIIQRALVFCGHELTPESFELPRTNEAQAPLPLIVERATREAEVAAISAALGQTGGNKLRAAKLLGISYKTLLNKIKEYQLSAGAPGGAR